jgi:23S rRNA C2498 (ribose-2'-O)-methylase RlmM
MEGVRMARLVVSNPTMSDLAIEIIDLARYKSLHELSEKRITKAVRDALRKQGCAGVEVSCSASLSGDVWVGKCRIDGISFDYRLMRGGLYDRTTRR